MKFSVLPVLEQMRQLYLMPRDRKRFAAYLQMLQGETKDDLLMPIAAYNPMAGPAVLERVETLQEMDAEGVIANTLNELNETALLRKSSFVALNLVDDLGGSWSQRALTAYSSRFDTRALFRRSFCAPVLWMSEQLSESLIIERTKAYALRFAYQSCHSWPVNLANWWAQEAHVYQLVHGKLLELNDEQAEFLEVYAKEDDYNFLFAFFLGDRAAETLGYMTFDQPGFRHLYAHY